MSYKYNLLSIEYNETKSYEIFYGSLFFGFLFFLTTIFYCFKIINCGTDNQLNNSIQPTTHLGKNHLQKEPQFLL